MNLGMGEMIFIFLLALVIFGPKKLPEIGRQLGKAMNEFKRASNEFRSQLEEEIRQIDAAEQSKEQAKRLAAPAELPGHPAADELTIAPPRESIAQNSFADVMVPDAAPSANASGIAAQGAAAASSNGSAAEILPPTPVSQEFNG
jgi:sec-independent protein translocase protein TatB